MSNWDMMVETINKLANSQGFYSRLKRNIESLDEGTLEYNRNYINNLPKEFKEPIDVILFLEQ